VEVECNSVNRENRANGFDERVLDGFKRSILDDACEMVWISGGGEGGMVSG
jgi:hypothetical protein